jgi:multicomponent K+:H+ antiporter subunit A
VLLAAATGGGALAFGRPFLTSFYGYAPVPVLGKVGAGSAFLFDLGVAAAVLGTVLLMFERLGLLGRARHARGETPAGETPAGETPAGGRGATASSPTVRPARGAALTPRGDDA